MARTPPRRPRPKPRRAGSPRRPAGSRARQASQARQGQAPEAPLDVRTERALRAALCGAGRRLFEIGLIGAAEGNLSARRTDGTFLVTPSGVSKGALEPGDLLVVDARGRVLEGHGRPSTELRMHLAAYAARPELAAAIHAHPLTAVALTVAGCGWPGDLVPEAAVTLGPVAVAPFAIPGTQDVPESLAPFLPDHDVILLSRHGALCLGATVAEAVDRMETLERVARIAVTARAVGRCEPLTPGQVEAVLRAAGKPPRRAGRT
jgi:L-fuculose-phosphate aldolase